MIHSSVTNVTKEQELSYMACIFSGNMGQIQKCLQKLHLIALKWRKESPSLPLRQLESGVCDVPILQELESRESKYHTFQK